MARRIGGTRGATPPQFPAVAFEDSKWPTDFYGGRLSLPQPVRKPAGDAADMPIGCSPWGAIDVKVAALASIECRLA